MRFLIRWGCVSVLLVCGPAVLAERMELRPDWGAFFDTAQVKGCIVVRDERKPDTVVMVYQKERAGMRYSPASTFKIPHTLFALEAGVVKDEFQKFKWDGQRREVEAWNADQDLRSAMRNSVVWVYEDFARKIGDAGERAALQKTGYGNADAGGKAPFWLEGNLSISAMEQVDFLRRLYRNQLPFAVEHQRLVKDLMIVEAGRDWILRAKTGWDGKTGWWVGWVEWPSGPVFFALNLDTPRRLEDTPKRESITRQILQSLQALPEN